jgi:biopolymer transport protein ExbB
MLELFLKGGILLYPIFFCSIVGVSLLINKYLTYRGLMKQLSKPVNEIMEDHPSLIAPILLGIEKGLSEEQISIIGTKQVMKVEKGLSWLELIATITPLIGLTGTVTGMIRAFQIIAASTHVNPAMLASGIWEALITTAAGLLVAIPIHVGHHYLEKKADLIAFTLKELTLAVKTST